MPWLRFAAPAAVAVLVSACAEVPVEAPMPSAAPAPVPEDPDPAGLSTLLPPPPGGIELGPELAKARSVVSRLIAADDGGAEAPLGDDLSDPRARAKIEAHFDRQQRFRDDYRVRATELVAVLMAALGDDPRNDLVRHALAAILLEDQGALGFGVAGEWAALDEVTAERLAEQLVRPRVPYDALAGQAYGRCAALASDHGWPTWARLCAQGARRMRLRAAALPACSDGSLIDGTGIASAAASASAGRGLLLNGAYGVPLLTAELTEVLRAAHRRLEALTGGALVAPELAQASAAPQSAQSPACARTPRPSDRLFAGAPDVEWIGLSLHCQGAACGVSACSHGAAGCFTAPVSGPPWKLSAWLEAIERLARKDTGALIETASEPDRSVDVTVDAVVFHGAWKSPDEVQRLLSAHLPRLSACQGTERYRDDWLLDVDRRGRVAGLRASSPNHPYPMDEPRLSPGARRCVRDALQGLQLPRQRGRGVRRLALSLHIPASLHVELPATLRHSRGIGPREASQRIARDGVAVGIARCMAGAELAPRAIGVCARVNAAGRVEGLDVDLAPLRSRRVRAVLADVPHAGPVPSGVQQCLAKVLDDLDWSCRSEGQVGHLAATLRLPRELLDRF